MLRLLRIARLFRYLNRLEDMGILDLSLQLLRLFKLTAFMFLFCHWNGCFQFLIASLDTPPYNGTAWPADYPDGFHKDSWVTLLDIATETHRTMGVGILYGNLPNACHLNRRRARHVPSSCGAT